MSLPGSKTSTSPCSSIRGGSSWMSLTLETLAESPRDGVTSVAIIGCQWWSFAFCFCFAGVVRWLINPLVSQSALVPNWIGTLLSPFVSACCLIETMWSKWYAQVCIECVPVVKMRLNLLIRVWRKLAGLPVGPIRLRLCTVQLLGRLVWFVRMWLIELYCPLTMHRETNCLCMCRSLLTTSNFFKANEFFVARKLLTKVDQKRPRIRDDAFTTSIPTLTYSNVQNIDVYNCWWWNNSDFHNIKK